MDKIVWLAISEPGLEAIINFESEVLWEKVLLWWVKIDALYLGAGKGISDVDGPLSVAGADVEDVGNVGADGGSEVGVFLLGIKHQIDQVGDVHGFECLLGSVSWEIMVLRGGYWGG